MNKRERIHQKFGGHCAYCGESISVKSMHIDHKAPIYRGLMGDRDRLQQDEDNLMPSCASCNNRKNVLSLDLFRSEIAAQVERLRRDSGAFRIAERYGLITATDKAVTFYFER